MTFKLYSIVFIFLIAFCDISVAQEHHLMPVPKTMEWGAQRFSLDKSFYVVLDNSDDSRASEAVKRFLVRLDNRTGLLIKKTLSRRIDKTAGVYLFINYKRTGQLRAGEDESYSLIVTGDQVLLEAETDLGVMHGLETFLQLIEKDPTGYFLPGVVIEDTPRFVWRGLLIDVCRHFMPMEVIKRNIDGMAMVKMNVLHLHLSEDQGFRVESKKFPDLHLKGSNGKYFTQEQVREIIRYAGARGIRVVPEFDMPGHASSWMVGYPQLASGPGPYAIEKKFGVFDPVMNPARKSTYKFLKKFIGEMASLFTDEYFHIGGDENNGKQWSSNKEIKEFMKKNDLKDNHELHNYFNNKLLAIVKKNHKKMIGWDEILQPGLPSDAMIQSWRGKEGVDEAATKGYKVILSNGYYIDLMQPAWKHYINDPIPADTKLSAELQAFVLGGEATMWAELVTEETVDSRIWPRTAAIAERLWSPREISHVPDMYRRLDHITIELEEVGLQHIRNSEMMLRRLTGNMDNTALNKLLAVTEPLKNYSRHAQGIEYSTDLPLTRLPDIAVPDSKTAREFRFLCEALVKKRNNEVAAQIEKQLHLWIDNHDSVVKACSGIPALKNWPALSLKLKEASLIALESIDLMNRRQFITDEWTRDSYNTLLESQKPVDESELAVMESIMMLFQNALPK